MKLDIYTAKNGERHLYIKKSFRNKDGKCTSVNVKKLGTYSELLKTHDDPIAWGKTIAEEMTQAEKENKKAVVSVVFDANKVYTRTVSPIFNCGYLYLQKIYYESGLNKICKEIEKRHNFEFDLNEILSRLVYGRILFPGSKLNTFEESKTLLEQPHFEIHDIYRALEVLAEESEYIQNELYKNSLSVIERNSNVLFYDCTNFFFESEEAAGIRQYGYSKEHRPNPIIQMGLFMDGNGIPLAFGVFPGNTNEQTTLRPLEEQILKDFNHSKVIVCTDAGLSSKENRKFNNSLMKKYVTVQSVKNMKEYREKWLFENSDWYFFKTVNDKKLKFKGDIEKLINDEAYQKTHRDFVFFKESWVKDDDGFEERYIASFSLKYRDYLRNIRSGHIKRAENIVNNGYSINRNDPKRFVKNIDVTTSGEVAEKQFSILDTEKIEHEAKYDGYYCIATNLDDDVSEILSINKRRWEIEESFRIMKTEFKSRPVYLSRDDRIKAHFLTCFIALYVYRVLEKKLDDCFTTTEIITYLRQMTLVEISNAGFIPGFPVSDLSEKLCSVLGLNFSFEFLDVQYIKNLIKISKK